MAYFKLGPDILYRNGKTGYIVLDNAQLRTQLSGEMLVTNQCSSLTELQAEVEKMKAELDQILKDAPAFFRS